MAFVTHYLESFSDNFLLAVLLWPFASVAFTLPILVYLYRRDGRLRFAHVIETYLAVLYVLGLACFAFYPLPSDETGLGFTYGIPWQLDPLRFIKDFQTDGWRSVPQLAFNVAFFMPLGFIAGRLFNMSFPKALLLGFCGSLLIEITQGTGIYGLYRYAYRTADVNDLMTNTLGACIGWFVASLYKRAVPQTALAVRDDISVHPSFIRRCVALAVDLIFVFTAAFVMCCIYSVWRAGGLNEQWDSYFDSASIYCDTLCFLLFETVWPALHKGMTPGGALVRMTFETKERHGFERALFYVVRVVVLEIMVIWVPVLSVFMIIFYLFARRAPYDFLPGKPYAEDTIKMNEIELAHKTV